MNADPTRPKVCHIIHLDGPGGGAVVVVDHLTALCPVSSNLSALHGGSGRIAGGLRGTENPALEASIGSAFEASVSASLRLTSRLRQASGRISGHPSRPVGRSRLEQSSQRCWPECKRAFTSRTMAFVLHRLGPFRRDPKSHLAEAHSVPPFGSRRSDSATAARINFYDTFSVDCRARKASADSQ